MSASRARGVARRSAVFAAVLALTATTTFTASAQEDPVAPSTEVTAPSTPAEQPPSTPDETPVTETPVTQPPVSETPVSETPADKPAETPADKPADTPADKPEEKADEKPATDEQAQADPVVTRSDVTATAEVVGGPFLIGQKVTVKLTITNKGPDEAIGVSAYLEHVSGTYLGIDYDGWDGLAPPWQSPTTKIPAGESRTFTLKGSAFTYAGNSKERFRVAAQNDRDIFDGQPVIDVLFQEPVKTGTISGVLWGDANGNGVQDAGEGLAGAQAYLYGGSNPDGNPKVRTDANGRFTFTGLELRMWGVGFLELPGGWVLEYSNEQIPVDGTDSSSELRYKAVRPLLDHLSASMRFTSTNHVAGGFATVEFTLTNSGGADLSGIIASCNRSGEGPHMGFPNGMGDLAWPNGATIRAGETRVFTLLAGISSSSDRYGRAHVACDFGPNEGIIDGYPSVFDWVKLAGDKRATAEGSIYEDRDGNGWMNGDEHLTDVSFSLVDPKTGVVAGTAFGTGEYGKATFANIPLGLYAVKVNGPWHVKNPEWLISVEDCTQWCHNGWTVEVVAGEGPGGTPGGGQPQPETPAKPEVVKVDTFRPTAKASPLAQTGASVEGLALAGALTLLLGGASIFLARRRTA
ncbi:SdrD B-like domain-containing protein [Lentzea sp. JNUCC 0626]|uniref:SdrD B-like domain-containing protein n=1 Tax=Lentzea sp. JNUCC 0626 TaxID=3367513 RepID=UPI0037496512